MSWETWTTVVRVTIATAILVAFLVDVRRALK